MERHLVAILAADVVGYFRLKGQEEASTLARLEGLLAEIVGPLIAQHHGRVVKLIGDGFLVEFARVVDALTCTLDRQSAVEACAGHPISRKVSKCDFKIIAEGIAILPPRPKHRGRWNAVE